MYRDERQGLTEEDITAELARWWKEQWGIQGRVNHDLIGEVFDESFDPFGVTPRTSRQ